MALEIFTRLGRLIRVRNSQARAFSNESREYISVWVKDSKGSRCLLFTDSEIDRAEQRADRNQEDLTQRSWISQLLD